MNILNEQVNHNKYGAGVIIGQADNIITVRFSCEDGTKKFLYPSIFESYLTFCSAHLQEEQQAEIARQRAELDAAAAQKLAEEEKLLAEKRAEEKTRKKKGPARKGKTIKSNIPD